MGQQARVAVDMRSFGGMVSAADPNDLEPGRATVQVNAQIIRPGQLSVRRGLREITFDEDD